MTEIEKMKNDLEPLRQELIAHDLYKNVDSIKSIQVFMKMHVFAVWDFMSLLKSLQRELTNTNVPWTPKGHRLSRRLINDIVLCEESDFNENNETMSHFEMYLDAMTQVEANTSDINTFIDNLNEGKMYQKSLEIAKVNEEIKKFIDFTFSVINTKKSYLIASVFTFGRENLIPDMFVEIVRKFNKNPQSGLSKLVYYLDRHIEVDGEEHGPMALNMITELCEGDEEKWSEAREVCKEALLRRIKLWDSINACILENN